MNATKLRSDALIISPFGLTSIPLQSLSYAEAAEWLNKNPIEYERPQVGKKNIQFRAFLAWLWRVCAQDILSAILDHESSPHLPRVWWMGIGLCAYFPFHAASIHDGFSQEHLVLCPHAAQLYQRETPGRFFYNARGSPLTALG